MWNRIWLSRGSQEPLWGVLGAYTTSLGWNWKSGGLLGGQKTSLQWFQEAAFPVVRASRTGLRVVTRLPVIVSTLWLPLGAPGGPILNLGGPAGFRNGLIWGPEEHN